MNATQSRARAYRAPRARLACRIVLALACSSAWLTVAGVASPNRTLADSSPSPCTRTLILVTCSYPNIGEFVVPAGVGQITTTVTGANGADGYDASENSVSRGGLGAVVTATLSTSALQGQTLYVYPGCAPDGCQGWSWGGDASFISTVECRSAYRSQADVSDCDDTAYTGSDPRLVIAGGGGGGGGGVDGGDGGSADAAGSTGADGAPGAANAGQPSCSSASSSGGGDGGSQSGPGSGGIGNPPPVPPNYGGDDGWSGDWSVGGRGGGGPQSSYNGPDPVDVRAIGGIGYVGGAGGGGYYGGGGGGDDTVDGCGAGGGAGSSWVNSAYLLGNVTFGQAGHDSQPGVVITYDQPIGSPTCSPDSSGDMVSCGFQWTGNPQTFVVPEGVTSISMTAVGGQGGMSGAENNGALNRGGYGATVSAAIAVDPGETLYVYLGSDGQSGLFGGVPGDAGGSANGTGGSGVQYDGGIGSGGGGGATIVQTCVDTDPACVAQYYSSDPNNPEPRLLVAAGGGGAGLPGSEQGDPESPDAGDGGDGDGLSKSDTPGAGGNGTSALNSYCPDSVAADGGQGGTQDGPGNADDAVRAGVLGNGGVGEGDGTLAGVDSGGGGGGGYYGGGGGRDSSHAACGGGGGAGSSYVNPDVAIGPPTYSTAGTDEQPSLTFLFSAPTSVTSSCATTDNVETCVYDPSAAAQELTVPKGVRQIAVTALGGQGGSGSSSAGGLGADVRAKMKVRPHEKLIVYVGGDGLSSRSGTGGGLDGGSGEGVGGAGAFWNGSGGGGGASSIQTCADSNPRCRQEYFSKSDPRLLVAGGGGGGGVNSSLSGGGGAGGNADAVAHHAGAGGSGLGYGRCGATPSPTGGAGATQTQPGQGEASEGSVSAAGGAGHGGAGADERTARIYFGGGGGGGYYGGGGGGDDDNSLCGGGGGAGSSWVNPNDVVRGSVSYATAPKGGISGCGIKVSAASLRWHQIKGTCLLIRMKR